MVWSVLYICCTTNPPLDSFGFNITAERKSTDPRRPIYLDAQATTPLDPRVLDKMLPWFTNQYGNPHSRTHVYGWESQDGVEEARAVSMLFLIRIF